MPKLMEMFFAALLVAAGLTANPTLGVPAEGPPPPDELRALRTELLSTLNAHRSEYGLEPLRVDPIAEQAAQFQAEDMLHSGHMGHFDSGGRSPIDRFDAFGGSADYYAENVGFYKPAVSEQDLLWGVLSLLDRQMMSEKPPNDGHRRNILGDHYSAVGIGIAIGPKGVFMSEDFVGFERQPADPTSSR